MAKINFVVITKLFWDTLEQHRSHARYPDLRLKIASCVQRRATEGLSPLNGDTPFTDLSDNGAIWHAKLTRNPDVVMFYVVDGDTMKLTMIGSHNDYTHNGKHRHKIKPLMSKIANAVSGGNVPSPEWRKIRWSVPQDIVDAWDLAEASLTELEALMDTLEAELHDAPIYRQRYGRDLVDEEENVIFDWLSVTDRALDAIRDAHREARAIRRAALDAVPAEEFIRRIAPGA